MNCSARSARHFFARTSAKTFAEATVFKESYEVQSLHDWHDWQNWQNRQNQINKTPCDSVVKEPQGAGGET
jgi:hypothetical protein